jgi:hypothetical protein
MLSCRVQFANFVYPSHAAPLIEAYEGRFESVFILLHPFIRVPEPLSWKATRQYPGDHQIITHGVPYPWQSIADQINLGSCARINQALLTCIASLKGDLADPAASAALANFLQTNPVWMPTEGRFEPLLQPAFLDIFSTAGYDQLIFVPEFPNSDPVVHLSLQALRNGSVPFPTCGTLLAPDAAFLFTVDWDSFFTLFYGSRSFVTHTASLLRLEGFFATPNTDHAWFNYSMGCATVTLSPEHWQQTV